MKFEESKEETCESIAPWLNDEGKPVHCGVPKKESHTVHGGNGWTWEYGMEHTHVHVYLEIDWGVYAWVCECGDMTFS